MLLWQPDDGVCDSAFQTAATAGDNDNDFVGCGDNNADYISRSAHWRCAVNKLTFAIVDTADNTTANYVDG
jgi:hypothetical protein